MKQDQRTDIHRPSSPDFDPEAYECYGVWDLQPDWPYPGWATERQAIIRSLTEKGYKIGMHGLGQCGHCGAHIRYAALMVREDVKEYIWVGEICLWGRFEDMTKIEFQKLRKQAQLDREKMRIKTAREQLINDHPLLVWLTYAPVITNSKGFVNGFLCGLNAKMIRYGELSPRQIETAERVILENTERDDRQAELDRLAAEALEEMLANGVKCPEGRVQIEGEVIKLKDYDGYMPGSTVTKMTVKNPAGWLVWGSVPSDIWDVEKGDHVRFTATVTPSGDDPLFGKFKRPVKAEVIDNA